MSKNRKGATRRYKDLLVGRFRITNVVRIERQDDPNTISRKWADYSLTSLVKLYEQGRNDALKRLVKYEFKSDLGRFKLPTDVKVELSSMLNELTSNLEEIPPDYTASIRNWLSTFNDRVNILNQGGKINSLQAEKIAQRLNALKSSLED